MAGTSVGMTLLWGFVTGAAAAVFLALAFEVWAVTSALRFYAGNWRLQYLPLVPFGLWLCCFGIFVSGVALLAEWQRVQWTLAGLGAFVLSVTTWRYVRVRWARSRSR